MTTDVNYYISVTLTAHEGLYTVDAGFMKLSIIPTQISRHMHFIATFIESIAKHIGDLAGFNASPDKAVMDRIIKHGTAILSTIDPEDNYSITITLTEDGKLTTTFGGTSTVNLFKMAAAINAMVEEDTIAFKKMMEREAEQEKAYQDLRDEVTDVANIFEESDNIVSVVKGFSNIFNEDLERDESGYVK